MNSSVKREPGHLYLNSNMNKGNNKTVAIVQSRLCHYSVKFFELLKEDLCKVKVALKLIHGLPNKNEQKRKDSGHIDWAIQVRNRSFKLFNGELLWQPYFHHIKDCDIVVITQENRLLMNYLLLLGKRLVRQKVAFWGHGKNCQSENPDGLREKWKRLWLKVPDWWFAYTNFTRDILAKEGYRPEKITVLNNAVDTGEILRWCGDITESEAATVKSQEGIKGNLVGIYCGSLYEHKRIGFLIEAAKFIRARISDFELVVIGAGPDVDLVKGVESSHPWIHYVGPKFGRDKVLYMKLGQVFLMPSNIGLGILDAFAMGLPLFTTDCKVHGPEIAYLRDSVNGCITPNNLDDYAGRIVDILNDPAKLQKMRENCRAASRKYTIEKMAANFTKGIVSCLSL